MGSLFPSKGGWPACREDNLATTDRLGSGLSNVCSTTTKYFPFIERDARTSGNRGLATPRFGRRINVTTPSHTPLVKAFQNLMVIHFPLQSTSQVRYRH